MKLDTFEAKRSLRLTDPQIAVLQALLDNKYVTGLEIEQMGSVSSSVTIYRMRAKLEDHGIVIHSMQRLGYWIDDEAREKLARFSVAEEA